MRKKQVHIVERPAGGDEFQVRKLDTSTSKEPARSVEEMAAHLNETHGPTQKLKKKGGSNA